MELSYRKTMLWSFAWATHFKKLFLSLTISLTHTLARHASILSDSTKVCLRSRTLDNKRSEGSLQSRSGVKPATATKLLSSKRFHTLIWLLIKVLILVFNLQIWVIGFYEEQFTTLQNVYSSRWNSCIIGSHWKY